MSGNTTMSRNGNTGKDSITPGLATAFLTVMVLSYSR